MIYTVKEIQKTIECLSDIFDIVRVVDPINMKILSFDEREEVDFDEYECYRVWNKSERCTNCISLRTYHCKKRLTKYDFLNDDVYQVVAMPIEILLNNNIVSDYILEIVSIITDEVMFEAFGKEEFIDKISSYEKKVYYDSMTKAFNRRYFDERIFIDKNLGQDNEMSFLFVDLEQFKLINDIYGHDIGDWVLINTVKTIKSCIREYDSVIRMGGDEFLIILKSCNIRIANRIVNEIKNSLKTDVIYDKANNKFSVVNIGISYTPNFDCTTELINYMLEKADENMYLDKRNSLKISSDD